MPLSHTSSELSKINTLNIVSDTTVVIPAEMSILQIVIQNTTGNAIVGGLKVGTTDGGVDVVVALSVSANSIQVITDAVLLKAAFSTSQDTTLYIKAVTLWNSASINLYFVLRKFT